MPYGSFEYAVFQTGVVSIYTNASVNNTTLYFIYNKLSILSGRHVSTFIRSSSGPLGKHIQELSIFQCIVGSQMFTDCYMNVKYISLYILVSVWPLYISHSYNTVCKHLESHNALKCRQLLDMFSQRA